MAPDEKLTLPIDRNLPREWSVGDDADNPVLTIELLSVEEARAVIGALLDCCANAD